MVDTQNKLSIVKQCRLLKFIVAVFIIKKTGKFRELENAITRPTVFYTPFYGCRKRRSGSKI
jgi:hypothetical protein